MNIKWLLVDSKISIKNINEAERFFKVKLPKEYIKICLKFNGGYPEPCCFDVGGHERVFESLLSLNKDDTYNIYLEDECIKDKTHINLIPFGSDPFGHSICFNYSTSNSNPSIVYFDTERAYDEKNYQGEYICLNFEEFLNMLHEPVDD